MSSPISASRHAIVTGGAKGFGAGIASALASSGYTVWITGRDEAALARTAKEVGCFGVRADVSIPGDWDDLLSRVAAQPGRIEVLVNNAGGGVKIAPAVSQSDADIASSIAVNLTGAIYGCARVAPILSANGGGTIINISSACARHAWPGWGVYGAAKVGLEQFSKSLYLELRPHGVRVTTLIPSWGATGFGEAAGLPPQDAAVLGKCIQPAEIGRMVAQICALPSHLYIQETILWPMVQEVNPL